MVAIRSVMVTTMSLRSMAVLVGIAGVCMGRNCFMLSDDAPQCQDMMLT